MDPTPIGRRPPRIERPRRADTFVGAFPERRPERWGIPASYRTLFIKVRYRLVMPNSPAAAYPTPFGRYVREIWPGDPGAYGGRRARRPFPFEAFVPVTLADRDFVLTAQTAAAVQDATVATVELNRLHRGNAALTALSTQLLRSEALASSRIEGLELSHRRLARAQYEAYDRKAAEVVGNVRAMQQAIELGEQARPLTTEDLCEIHATLLASVYDAKIAGRVRGTQNWVGINASSPSGAEFVPPPARFVPELLGDLCAFVEREDLPEIAQAAVAHAQFETIHPYGDGNGRLGRCLIHLILRRRAIAAHRVPPISLVLVRSRESYVAGLTAYRAGDVDGWIRASADATYTAAQAAATFAGRVEEQEERWLDQAGRPRAGSAARIVIEHLPQHPVLDGKTVQRVAGCSDVAALRALTRLEEAGVISPVREARRNRVWECRVLFDLLNEFEDDPVRTTDDV